MDETIMDLIKGIKFSARLTDYYDELEHSHTFYEIVIITTGSITHVTGKNVSELTVGDGFLICPDIKHKYIRKDSCIHRDIMISEDIFKEACDYIDASLYSNLREKGFVRFKMSKNDVLSVEDMISTFFETSNKIDRNSYAKIISCSVIGHIFSYEKLGSYRSNGFKSKCLTSINENYNLPDALERLRKDLGYSEVYFCKKFRESFSETPTDYINSVRIQNASYLLVSSSYNINEICETVGFLSIPYFIKLFKRYYGTTPAAYRKTAKKAGSHITTV